VGNGELPEEIFLDAAEHVLATSIDRTSDPEPSALINPGDEDPKDKD
jgi:hypothetical protein